MLPPRLHQRGHRVGGRAGGNPPAGLPARRAHPDDQGSAGALRREPSGRAARPSWSSLRFVLAAGLTTCGSRPAHGNQAASRHSPAHAILAAPVGAVSGHRLGRPSAAFQTTPTFPAWRGPRDEDVYLQRAERCDGAPSAHRPAGSTRRCRRAHPGCCRRDGLELGGPHRPVAVVPAKALAAEPAPSPLRSDAAGPGPLPAPLLDCGCLAFTGDGPGRWQAGVPGG